MSRFPLPWRLALYAALCALIVSNLIMVAVTVGLLMAGSDAIDWHTYRAAVERYPTGNLYEQTEWWYGWRYSPVAVLPMLAVAWMGELAWRILHFVALLGLPRRLAMWTVLTYPFWFDVSAGNPMIFIAVGAYHALRGNGWGIGALLITALLIPRPLMVPLVGYLLWKHGEWRWPFVGMFALHALAVWGTGYGDEWVARLMAVGGEELVSGINVAPSFVLGGWWMLVAVPLAALAFMRGYPATAGLLLQIYWLPYYLLLLLADWNRWKRWWPAVAPQSKAQPQR